jgi:hypothetical protein
MHNYGYLEALAADRIRRRFAEAEESGSHATLGPIPGRRAGIEPRPGQKVVASCPPAGQRRVLPATPQAFDPKGEHHDRRF